jgi:hypothetical protein
MTTKNDDFTQFARVCDSIGQNQAGAGAINDGSCVLTDAHGRLLTVSVVSGILQSGFPTVVDSGAVVQWQLINGGFTVLYQAWGSQVSGANLWVQFHNQAAGPPAGAPDVAPIACVNNGIWSVNFPTGLVFSTGLVIGYSTAHTPYALPAVGGWVTAIHR